MPGDRGLKHATEKLVALTSSRDAEAISTYGIEWPTLNDPEGGCNFNPMGLGKGWKGWLNLSRAPYHVS